MTADSLTTMLLRKHDWHDGEGARWLLEHGADPNRRTRWRTTPFQQALQRDNALETIVASIDHGADPIVAGPEGSGIQIAARRGRRDVLELLDQRGVALELQGLDLLLAACARDDGAALRAIVGREPGLVRELVAGGGRSLMEFAGVGNTEGVRNLLDLGVPVAAVFREGDPYWDLAANSTALHAAAWRGRHATVAMLIERGAPIEALDARGRTPLALALRACVDSYWTERRATESIRALLEAGASTRGLTLPSGYAEADALLSRHGAER